MRVEAERVNLESPVAPAPVEAERADEGSPLSVSQVRPSPMSPIQTEVDKGKERVSRKRQQRIDHAVAQVVMRAAESVGMNMMLPWPCMTLMCMAGAVLYTAT